MNLFLCARSICLLVIVFCVSATQAQQVALTPMPDDEPETTIVQTEQIELTKLFNEADKDNDSKLDLVEFKSLFKSLVASIKLAEAKKAEMKQRFEDPLMVQQLDPTQIDIRKQPLDGGVYGGKWYPPNK